MWRSSHGGKGYQDGEDHKQAGESGSEQSAVILNKVCGKPSSGWRSYTTAVAVAVRQERSLLVVGGGLWLVLPAEFCLPKIS